MGAESPPTQLHRGSPSWPALRVGALPSRQILSPPTCPPTFRAQAWTSRSLPGLSSAGVLTQGQPPNPTHCAVLSSALGPWPWPHGCLGDTFRDSPTGRGRGGQASPTSEQRDRGPPAG